MERRDYYVSVVRSAKQRGLLAGPFRTHDEALAHVDRAKTLACEIDPWCDFDAFGTCSLPYKATNPIGALNRELAIN